MKSKGVVSGCSGLGGKCCFLLQGRNLQQTHIYVQVYCRIRDLPIMCFIYTLWTECDAMEEVKRNTNILYYQHPIFTHSGEKQL